MIEGIFMTFLTPWLPQSEGLNAPMGCIDKPLRLAPFKVTRETLKVAGRLSRSRLVFQLVWRSVSTRNSPSDPI